MQVQLRGLASDTILQLLQPEGAQHILRDTAELSALRNISYRLLAGSLAPQKSEWSCTLWVCTSAHPNMDLPLTAAGAERGCVLPFWLGTCPQPPQPSLLALGMEELGKVHMLHTVSTPWDWGDHRYFGLPRLLFEGLLISHFPGIEVPVEMVSWTTGTTPQCGRSGPSSWTGTQEAIPMQTLWEGTQGNLSGCAGTAQEWCCPNHHQEKLNHSSHCWAMGRTQGA